MDKKRKISIIGSTGSIGTQALEVIEKLRDKFEIIALAGGNNVELLKQQAKKFKPKFVYAQKDVKIDGIKSLTSLDEIAEKLPEATEINKKKVIQRVKQTVESIGRNRLERKLQLERQKVRQFVFNALEDEYYKNISPRIANIIATYIESGV